jgi:hypothetical protein
MTYPAVQLQGVNSTLAELEPVLVTPFVKFPAVHPDDGVGVGVLAVVGVGVCAVVGVGVVVVEPLKV